MSVVSWIKGVLLTMNRSRYSFFDLLGGALLVTTITHYESFWNIIYMLLWFVIVAILMIWAKVDE